MMPSCSVSAFALFGQPEMGALLQGCLGFSFRDFTAVRSAIQERDRTARNTARADGRAPGKGQLGCVKA